MMAGDVTVSQGLTARYGKVAEVRLTSPPIAAMLIPSIIFMIFPFVSSATKIGRMAKVG